MNEVIGDILPLAVAAGLTGLGGLIAALQALSRRPAPVLRGD